MAEQIVSTPDFGTQTQTKEREIKTRIKKPQFKVPWINFGYLWKEFKNIKLKRQDPSKNLNTIDSPLNEESIQTKKAKVEKVKKFIKANWLKASVISFLLFVSSTYDVVSDGLLSYSFLNGSYYTKLLENPPDSQFWTIKDEILVNKDELWDSDGTIDWNFSRDYSWADTPGFEKIYIVSCKQESIGHRRRRRRSAETKKYTYAPQLWKLEGNKLQNKDGLWVSDDAWNFKPQNNSFYIENISKTKVLEERSSDNTILLEDFKENKKEQLWEKGEPYDEGYFTLKNAKWGSGLTAFSSNSLKAEGLYYDANLKSGNDGSVNISAVSDSQEYCTPANCSELFWKREFGVTIGDEVYYTLESYNTERVLTAKGVKEKLEINTPLNNLVGKCKNTRIYENTNYDPANKSATIKSDTIYEYRCFETDNTWGILSLTFMCVPGLFFWIFIMFSLTKMDCWPEESHLKYGYIGLLAVGMLPLIIVYPFLLILVKFTSIFHHGLQWKKLDQFMTLCEGQLEGYLQVILQTYIVCRRADRVPSLIQISALTTSILVILLGQANAWYANQPESNIVKDIKRKISIAILLLVPNAATLGSGLMIALTIVSHRDSITSWNAWILGIGLLVSFGCFCVYWVFSCCPLPFCSNQTLRKRMLPLVLTTCYCLLLSIVIWTIVDVNINNASYNAYIIEELKYFKILAGLNVGLGFFPLTSFIVYYWISICIRRKETTSNQQGNEIA